MSVPSLLTVCLCFLVLLNQSIILSILGEKKKPPTFYVPFTISQTHSSSKTAVAAAASKQQAAAAVDATAVKEGRAPSHGQR
jgi:hypothetical protein